MKKKNTTPTPHDATFIFELDSKQAWLDTISTAAQKVHKGQWLVGGRWNVQLLPNKQMPTLAELDAITPDVPVALVDNDYHSLWINSKAMKMLGINQKTQSPRGGEIVRDAEGKLTGVFKETAQLLIQGNSVYASAQPPRTEGLRTVIKHFNSLGVTSVHDMINHDFSAYKSLLEEGKFPMRVWFGFIAPTDDEASSAQTFLKYSQKKNELDKLSQEKEHTWQEGPQFRFGYIKYFVDGTLANYTAALNEPYADRHDHFTGKPIQTQEHLNKLVRLANSVGFPVAIHAIGDKSVDMALNAFASSKHDLDICNRIEHVESLTPQSLPRFGRENVVASMQPDHAIDGNFQESRLGKARLPLSYAWQSLLSSGATVVLGSDWPTAKENPMLQLNDAVKRSKDGKSWYPENALSFDEALYAYTQAPANLAGWGKEIGSITCGKWADFVILEGEIQQPVPQDISHLKVDETWFAGKVVYNRQK